MGSTRSTAKTESKKIQERFYKMPTVEELIAQGYSPDQAAILANQPQTTGVHSRVAEKFNRTPTSVERLPSLYATQPQEYQDQKKRDDALGGNPSPDRLAAYGQLMKKKDTAQQFLNIGKIGGIPRRGITRRRV
jgi:hypothetical protein